MNTPIDPPGYRLAMLSRVLAAVLGGYGLASVAILFLSHVLPSSLPEAILGATMLSFAIYIAAIVWVFAAASATRAWFGLLLPATVMVALSWLLASGGA